MGRRLPLQDVASRWVRLHKSGVYVLETIIPGKAGFWGNTYKWRLMWRFSRLILVKNGLQGACDNSHMRKTPTK